MATKELKITQGDTFEWLILVNDVNGSPLDMSNYAGGINANGGARGKIRKAYTDANATEDFNISILDKTGVLSKIDIGECHLTTSEITNLRDDTYGACYLLVRLTAIETAAIPKGNYVYDIEIEDTWEYVFKPYAGTVIISPEATK